MALQPPAAGINSVADFLLPGIPWVTSSTVSGVVHYSYGYVTRTVTVKNVAGGNLRVAFTENGLTKGNYVELVSGESISETIRTTGLWLSGSGNSVSVLSGLVPVQSNMVGFRLTGSTGPLYQGMG